MTDSESREIGDKRSRVAKSKGSIELQPIRRQRYLSVVLHALAPSDPPSNPNRLAAANVYNAALIVKLEALSLPSGVSRIFPRKVV